jgi:hypothetical protein
MTKGTSPSAARVAASRYLEHVNSRQDMRPLFAEGAVLLEAGGDVVQGREAIGAYFERHLGGTTAILRPRSVVTEGDAIVLELEAQIDDSAWRLAAADHFTVDNDGLIARLVVYLRSPTAQPEPR